MWKGPFGLVLFLKESISGYGFVMHSFAGEVSIWPLSEQLWNKLYI